jgi:hypothetical protein
MRLGREVAVEVIRRDLAGTIEARSRFLREAGSAAALSHPNIATLHDVGETGETLWLVMELVKGVSLRLRLTGPVPEKLWRQFAVNSLQRWITPINGESFIAISTREYLDHRRRSHEDHRPRLGSRGVGAAAGGGLEGHHSELVRRNDRVFGAGVVERSFSVAAEPCVQSRRGAV